MKKYEVFRCQSCGESITVDRDHMRTIELGINLVLENANIRDSKKISYISEYEAGVNFGRLIVPDIDIMSKILNNIIICCPDRNWKWEQSLGKIGGEYIKTVA